MNYINKASSVVRTLLVEIAGEAYAFGLTRIEQVLMLPRSDIALSENCPFFLLNDQPVVLILAHQVLDLPLPTKNPDTLSVIVISDRINHYGLVVDRLLGESSLVVRPLDPRLGKIPHISAAALLDNGSPVLIVDIEDLVNSIGKVLGNGQINQVNKPVNDTVTKNYKSVLVVDDSITVREMERKLLENNGYKVEVAVNGVDAWNAVRNGNYDLVVTDIDMPRMNGFELTNQIKIHAKLKHTPVINDGLLKKIDTIATLIGKSPRRRLLSDVRPQNEVNHKISLIAIGASTKDCICERCPHRSNQGFLN